MRADLPSNTPKDQHQRLRTWLRANTHWRNTHEFFVALLFETRPPPHPLTHEWMYGKNNWKFPEWTGLLEWRDEVARAVVARLPRTISKTHVLEEYFRWLLREQENNHISRL